MLSRSKCRGESYRVLSGYCPDDHCKTKLYFPAWDTSIECTGCGQRHEKSAILNIEQVTDPEVALHNMVRNVLLGNVVPKKGSDSIRVLGLSNYHCKLLAPILTTHGMDKAGKAKPLPSLNQGDIFDCSILGDRAFQINPEHINITGYGRDQTGSVNYLEKTIEMIHRFNKDHGEVLIPLHADGDGHCLVHAVSRALVGREFFWHALRVNLRNHFESTLDRYKALFHDFIDVDEWITIIAECDPEFIPYDGEALGLRNIHIFGLANVLHRPIILLDSLGGLQSSADYSGVFLPALVPVEKCKGKDGTLHKPLCIAWSSSGRNHYIPMVGVKGRPLPKIPRWMMAKAWGLPQESMNQYVEFDTDNLCTIGGERTLGDKYIQKLATAMEEVFQDKYKVHPLLVADMYQYVYKRSGIVGILPEEVTEAAQRAVDENRLYRCQTCDAITEFSISPDWFTRGGMLYSLAETTHGKLQHTKKYSFPMHGLICSYDPLKDELVPDMSHSGLTQCTWCQGNSLRLVKGDGTIVYTNGDRTKTSAPTTRCNCGFKHYWDGKEYDNLPETIPVELSWGGKSVKETVYWFQYESIPAMNSNAYEIASDLTQKHFPGEFGSERLIQSVANSILTRTAKKEEDYKPITLAGMQAPETPFVSEVSTSRGPTSPRRSESSSGPTSPRRSDSSPGPSSPRTPVEQSPTKMILTGFKSTTFHKEELNMSEKERQIKERVETQAPLQQKRATLVEERRKHRDEWKKRQEQDMKKEASTSKQTEISGGNKTNVQPPKPTGKKIRLSTSDGRQLMMSLETAITYKDLQTKIESELHVPTDRQKIKFGFPPKELKPPEDGKEDEPIPLQHGDKVVVEILPDPNQPKEQPMETQSYEPTSQPRQAWSSSAEQESASEQMQGMEQLAQDQGAELDLQISSMALMATITGSDLWNYVQNMPQLFVRNGLFYRQVERDLGLADNKHFTLPTLPNKTFRYSAATDSLELCLEPLGHFPVGPGVDDPANLSKLASEKIAGAGAGATGGVATQDSEQDSMYGRLAAGASGVIKPGMSRDRTTRLAFTGQAHTLSESSSQSEVFTGQAHTLSESSTSAQSVAFTGQAHTLSERRSQSEAFGGQAHTLSASTSSAVSDGTTPQVKSQKTEQVPFQVDKETEGTNSENVEIKDSSHGVQESPTEICDLKLEDLEKQDSEVKDTTSDDVIAVESTAFDDITEVKGTTIGDVVGEKSTAFDDDMDTSAEPNIPISPMQVDSTGPNLLTGHTSQNQVCESMSESESKSEFANPCLDSDPAGASNANVPALVRTDTQPFTLTSDTDNRSQEVTGAGDRLVAKKVGPGYTILTRETTEKVDKQSKPAELMEDS
ncbi:deubiquitinating protein VCPIP1-like [Glandiceps talaboti]